MGGNSIAVVDLHDHYYYRFIILGRMTITWLWVEDACAVLGQVDFANRFIGGAILQHGNTQVRPPAIGRGQSSLTITIV
jgi:hypothetical protein